MISNQSDFYIKNIFLGADNRANRVEDLMPGEAIEQSVQFNTQIFGNYILDSGEIKRFHYTTKEWGGAGSEKIECIEIKIMSDGGHEIERKMRNRRWWGQSLNYEL